MTAINIIAGLIYSKGHKPKEKIQLIITALVFLFILYNSPSGLVLYWTMNNLISLVKNVFYRFGGATKRFCNFQSLVCRAKTGPVQKNSNGKPKDCGGKKSEKGVFFASSLALAILTGLAIPSIIIESEPNAFCYIDNIKSPLVFLANVFLQSLSTFFIWPLCFYFLFSDRIKKAFSFFFPTLLVFSTINAFLFTGNYGPLSQDLDFMQSQTFFVAPSAFTINFAIFIAICALRLVDQKKCANAFFSTTIVICICLCSYSFMNVKTIKKSYKNMEPPKSESAPTRELALSRTKKNVIVFMQDRMLGTMVDDIFKADESLKDGFDGFVFFPNTVSFGTLTMLGSPGLFGGYDYTPWEINQNKSKTLQQKHNEALLSMPLNFLSADFDVYVCDLPYENYYEQPVAAMYKDWPAIKRTPLRGKHSGLYLKSKGLENPNYLSGAIKRNLIMVSAFKISAPIFRRLIHHNVWWNTTEKDKYSLFVDNFSELHFLPQLFTDDSQKGAFIIIDNEATHEPSAVNKDGTPKAYSEKGADFDSHTAAMSAYKIFFEWLKKQNLYDNTRIIIVSDHGFGYNSGKFDNSAGVPPYNKEKTNATILLKDFDSRGELFIDMTFMTNADTPFLATKNIILNAKNPWTGNSYQVKDKGSRVKICSPDAESTRNRNHKKFDIADDDWHSVSGDIFKSENWKQLRWEERAN